jgi:uncharacterized protein with NRDE domain
MCLAIVALHALPDWPLIVLANRDELHIRPTLAANPWSDAGTILAGRDLNAGGTWLGITTQGRVALLTNYREPGQHDSEAPSRGQLTDGYLRGEDSPDSYARSIQARGIQYNGFNLILADASGLWYCTNRGHDKIQQLSKGVVGLSNASLNTPWPKLKRTQRAVSEHLTLVGASGVPDHTLLFDIMQDTRSASIDELPDTGVGPDREKLLGSPFIKNERYGTRCTTLILRRSDGMIRFHEKRFDAHGLNMGESLWTVDTINQRFLSGTVETFNF